MRRSTFCFAMAACVFAGVENYLLTHPKEPCKPTATVTESCPADKIMVYDTQRYPLTFECLTPDQAKELADPVFHQQSQIWIETVSIGGEPYQKCPEDRVCI